MNRTALILLSLVIASPLYAGSVTTHRDYLPLRQQMHQLDRQINRATKRGEISGKQAHRLRQQKREIRLLNWAFRQDGLLTYPERRILQRRIDRIDASIGGQKRRHRGSWQQRRDWRHQPPWYQPRRYRGWWYRW